MANKAIPAAEAAIKTAKKAESVAKKAWEKAVETNKTTPSDDNAVAVETAKTAYDAATANVTAAIAAAE